MMLESVLEVGSDGLELTSDLNLVRFYFKELRDHRLKLDGHKRYHMLKSRGIITPSRCGEPWSVSPYGKDLMTAVGCET